ncbi:hypothetical protein ACETK8_19205 [Brevundimonas staleyi]|uniref:Lipoprotein n=1 Tax=Brevundimonas staleyi TaxID=74326 RepID=A0ABW0FTM8_9CAUL
MKTILRGALALTSLVALSACGSDLITGGPLIRPGEPLGQIQVVNTSVDPLDAVLLSDCSASTYGLNRLPRGTSIRPGGAYSFTVSAGCWDVMAGTIGYGDGKQRIQVPAGSIQQVRVR